MFTESHPFSMLPIWVSEIPHLQILLGTTSQMLEESIQRSVFGAASSRPQASCIMVRTKYFIPAVVTLSQAANR